VRVRPVGDRARAAPSAQSRTFTRKRLDRARARRGRTRRRASRATREDRRSRVFITIRGVHAFSAPDDAARIARARVDAK